MSTTPLLMSLADVARLAKVKRPVASMWRSRSRGSDHPFPAPATRRGNQELFDADAVAAWLEETGRGNNPEPTRDAAAHIAAQTVDGDELSALLALRTIADEPLSSRSVDGLLDLADETDPDDEFLYRELESARSRIQDLARLADRMGDAVYTPAAAFEKVITDQRRNDRAPEAQTVLSASLLSLVAEAADALAATTGTEHFHDASPGGSSLLPSVVDHWGEIRSARLSIGSRDNDHDATEEHPSTRQARRRLHVLAATRDHITIESPDSDRARLFLAQYPGPAAPDAETDEVLLAVDELALSLGKQDTALIIGPASVLVDAVGGEAELHRSQILRSGRVRAIVRLPAGLAPARNRQPMGFLVIGAEQGDRAIAERTTMVADLSTTSLDTAARQDLVADLAASLGGGEDVWAHAFRFGRLAPTSGLVADGGSLTSRARRTVPTPTLSPTASSPADFLVRAEQLLDEIARLGLPASGTETEASPHLQTISLHPGGQRAAEWTTVGALLNEGSLRYLPGTRLTDDEVTIDGAGLEVIEAASRDRGCPGPARSPASTGRVHQLAFAAAHPRAQLTEPQDVIFQTGPTVFASVDRFGSAVVRSPVRALRVHPNSGLVPEVLAVDLAANTGNLWRQWSVRRFTPDTADHLQRALDALNKAREATARQLDRLDHLTEIITAGTAAGALQATTEGTA